jgi:hypothetical protein
VFVVAAVETHSDLFPVVVNKEVGVKLRLFAAAIAFVAADAFNAPVTIAIFAVFSGVVPGHSVHEPAGTECRGLTT